MDTKEHIIPENTAVAEQIVLNLDADQPKKKIKKWPFIIGAAALVIVALVAALWKPIVSLFEGEQESKSIMDYEAEAFGQLTDSFIEGYTVALSSEESEAFGTKCRIEFDIDPLALKVIEKEMPDLAVLGALNDISLDAAMENDGQKYRVYLAPNHTEAELPTIEVQYEPASNRLFFILAGLSNDYLEFDLSAFSDEPVNTPELPAPEKLESLLNSYFEDLVGLMEEQSVTEETVSVDGVEQICTAYTASVELEALAELNVRSLDELVSLFGGETELPEELLEAIDELKAALEEQADNASLSWTDYIDSKGRIIGRKLMINEDAVMDYLFVTNDGEFVFFAACGDIEISGSGTVKDDVLNGKLILFVDGENYLELKPEDVLISDREAGKLSGTVGIELSDELVMELLGSDPGLPVNFDVAFDITKEKSGLVINYMDMVSVTFGVTQYAPEPISLPDGTAIDGSDTDALYRWLEGMDILKITDELEKAGIADLFN